MTIEQARKMFEAMNPAPSKAWMESFIATYVERDNVASAQSSLSYLPQYETVAEGTANIGSDILDTALVNEPRMLNDWYPGNMDPFLNWGNEAGGFRESGELVYQYNPNTGRNDVLPADLTPIKGAEMASGSGVFLLALAFFFLWRYAK